VLWVMWVRVGVRARTLGSGLDANALQPISALHGPDRDKEYVKCNQ
jgi:hypothetical protein